MPLVRSPRSRVGVCGVLGRGAGRGPRKVCPCAHRLVAGGLRGSRRGGPESHPGKLTRTPPATFGFFSNRPSSRSKGGSGFKSGSKRVLAMRFQEVPSGSQLSVWKGFKNATKVFKGKVVSIRTGQIARKTHVEVVPHSPPKGSGNGLGPLWGWSD